MSDGPGRRRARRPSEAGDPALAACRRLRALRAWARAYLHEDFASEYGSPVGAVQAFRRDATPAELRSVRDDWRVFSTVIEGRDLEVVAGLISGGLGAAWAPASARELAEVGRALESA